jgi:nicotinamidase-related amidase
MPPQPSPARLSAADSAVLVVDVQEKLLPKIHGAADVERNIAFLLDACKVLNVPATATEQYPKGLGATVPELARRLSKPLPDKLAFSSCAVPAVVDGFRSTGRSNVLVVGIETHVCIMQTVLDLIARNLRVFVAADAVGSRYPIDHETALRRMEQAGAIPCTVESAVFELTVAAGTPAFKEISQLVQDRMKSLTA